MPKQKLPESAILDMRDSPINLRACPSPHPYHISQFTLGDLHANAIKFIHALIQNGVCQTLSSETYNTLLEIYESPAPLSYQQFSAFNDFIDNELHIKNPEILVRLIGDTLADRGRNDWFILKILKKLKDCGVNIRILMSNHDLAFLQGIGFKGNKRMPALTTDMETLEEMKGLKLILEQPFIGDDVKNEAYQQLVNISTSYEINWQGNSFIELTTLIEDGLVTWEEINALVDEVYLPNLLLVDSSEFNEKIKIFTHGHIAEENIAALAFQFDVPPMLDSAIEKKATIDAINQKFQAAMQAGNLDIFTPSSAANCIIWQRQPELHTLAEPDARYKEQKNTFYICGHDSSYPKDTSVNVINLDNQLGKGDLENPDNDMAHSYISDEPICFLAHERLVAHKGLSHESSSSTDKILSQLNASPQIKPAETALNLANADTNEDSIEAANILAILHEKRSLTTSNTKDNETKRMKLI